MVLNVSARGQVFVTRSNWMVGQDEGLLEEGPSDMRHFVNCRTVNRWEERLGGQGNASPLGRASKA